MSKGNVIIVTGASSGIGLKTVLKLMKNSDNTIIAASRNIEKRKEDFGFANNVIKKYLDVSNENSVISFFDYVNKACGKPDSIVNCAGFVEPKSLFETTSANWQKTFDVNLTGTFLIAKYGCFLMKQNGGKLINIASTAGMSPRPGWSAYAASKAGVINFSLTIAEELKVYGIKTFVICPGRTATPLRRILAPDEDPQTIMQPEAVADIIGMLLDEKADVLEGNPIVVRARY